MPGGGGAGQAQGGERGDDHDDVEQSRSDVGPDFGKQQPARVGMMRKLALAADPPGGGQPLRLGRALLDPTPKNAIWIKARFPGHASEK